MSINNFHLPDKKAMSGSAAGAGEYGSSTAILLLAPLKLGCGNCTTARRLKALLTNHHNLFEQDPKQFSQQGVFHEYLASHNVRVVIALHALHCGYILDACPVPFILLFGGTDLNQYSQDPKAMVVMTTVVHQARYLVGFSKQMLKIAQNLWPDVENRLSVIPQAVTLPKSISAFSYVHHLWEKCGSGEISKDSCLFTLVSSLRPVKCPLFLLDTFSEWHQKKRPNVFLVILGPVMETDYSVSVLKKITRCPGVVYGGCLPHAEALAAMSQSFAVVNSSQSEGMASAILEAMAVGSPVIARNIPGNAAIVRHNHSGLLYESPQEFIECAEELMIDPDKWRHLVDVAHSYIAANHCAEKEKSAYNNLIRKVTTE